MVVVGLGRGGFEAWWLWVGSWWVYGGWGVASRDGAVVTWGYGLWVCLVVVCVCLFVCSGGMGLWVCLFVCFFSLSLSWWWHDYCGQCLVVFGGLFVCVCVFFLPVGGSCWWVWWFF